MSKNNTNKFTLPDLFNNEIVEIKPVNNIAVVGSSGSLLMRNYSKSIDSNNYVIRCNDAQIKNYSNQVGNKNIIRVVAHSAVKNITKEHLNGCNYLICWFPPQNTQLVKNELGKFRNICPNCKILALTGKNLNSIYNFYTNLTNVPKINGIWVSTGFIAFSIGVALSDKNINLYGYGCFSQNNNAPFHYYGKQKTEQKIVLLGHQNHKFVEEANGYIRFKNKFKDRLNIFV